MKTAESVSDKLQIVYVGKVSFNLTFFSLHPPPALSLFLCSVQYLANQTVWVMLSRGKSTYNVITHVW